MPDPNSKPRLSLFRDTPNSVKTLRRAYKDKFRPFDAAKLHGELIGESDRASVILASSLLEDILTFRISKHFCFSPTDEEYDQCFRFDGTMGSFSRKTEIALIFGIIDDRTYQKLDTIREMRNACAHSKYPLTFADEVLQNVANRISPPIGHMPIIDETPRGRKLSFIGEAVFIYANS
jgi:hypothetical protein